MTSIKESGMVSAQIVLKSARFEHRADFLSVQPLTAATNAELSGSELSVEVTVLDFDNTDDAGVIVKVFTPPSDTSALYSFSAEYLGIFRRAPTEPSVDPKRFVRTAGAVNMLYPFVREAVANLTMRGRFGPIWLNPIRAVDMPLDDAAVTEAESESTRSDGSRD